MEHLQYIDWHNFPVYFSALSSASTQTAPAHNASRSRLFYGCRSADGWSVLSPRYSDLSPCVVQGALMGALGVLGSMAALHQLVHLYGRKISVSNRVSVFFYIKLVLVAAQIGLNLAIASALPHYDILRTSAVSNVVASVLMLALHYLEQFKTSIPNGVLLFYWLFSSVFGALRVLNLTLRHKSGSHLGVLAAFFTANSLLILLIELLIPIKSVIPYEVKASPYDRANVFSRITFSWMADLIRKGYYKFLTEEDLPSLPEELRTLNTSDAFYKAWNSQTKNPSVMWAITQAFGLKFALGGVFKALQDILGFVQPQLLKQLIQFVNEYTASKKAGDPIPLTRGYMIALGMFVVSVFQTGFLHQYFQTSFDMGMKIKSSLTNVIYNKALILANDAKQESTTGDIVNLMSVDTQRLQDLVQNVQIAWSGPFQIILCLWSLYNLLGNAMWAGVVIMVVMIPINGYLAAYQKKLQKIQMKNKDERSRITSEILNNIKSLKLYAWEDPYFEKLSHIRNEKELRNLQRIGVFSAFTGFAWNMAPILVSCSTFGLFILLEKDKSLSSDIVFPALALFNLLSFPLAVIPMVVTNVVEAQVSLGRLHKFLNGHELQESSVIRLPKVSKNGEVAVKINNATFLWNKPKGNASGDKVALSNITLEAKKGELDCIVGKVGSGKSSIIQAVLGDLYKLQGDVEVHGKMAYVAQVPWIMNGSIKENILFGHKYDPEFYQLVLKACALSVDLKILPKGDKTQVGEKGISLSGGQKARLSLARAVYARADVYLIDDALSAVDEHVGRHLIEHVLGPNGLLSTKCRILATNNIGVLSVASSIHMVSEGKIVEQGTYDEIMAKESSLLFQLIKEFGKAKETSDEPKEEKKTDIIDPEETTGPDYSQLDSDDYFEIKSLRRASIVSVNDQLEELIDAKIDEDEETEKRKEQMQQGKVKWDVYLQYAKACNPARVMFYLSVMTAATLVSVASNLWLKHWSEVNSEVGYNPHVGFYLVVYLLFGLLSSALYFAQGYIVWVYITINGSKKLHKDMAISVLRAPMSFFETTPIGRILNRFSNDVYKVDEILVRTFSMFFGNAIKVTFTLVVICFSTWPFVFLIVPLLALYVYYQQYYLRSSRELRRLDSISRSPIFANFQESLNGVSTIRAYSQEDRFKYLNRLRIDKNMRAFHPAINSNRWLAVRLEFIGSVIIFGASGLSIVMLAFGSVSSGLVGLSVSYALQITQSLNWIVRMTVDVETNIVSVERILEYSQLTPEAPKVIEDNRPAENWPDKGRIEFKNYSTKYRPELDLVLKNINLAIDAKEKIGIVGRTGAGKSSLTLALFRIIEAVNGNIDIDEVNTSKIGLQDLRQKLSIIPQDSQVFEGTIRTNLDPFNRFSTEQLWAALELSHLKNHVLKMYEEAKANREDNDERELNDGLDVRLSEGGSNLSVGQRQLMCLARALLIPSHILVLDEATAAVDVETDKVLQETIRKEFKDRTILTIAHRINTILDSDKIIVLEKGEVAEFDKPEVLLKNKESLFYALCKQGGFVKDE